VPDQDVSGRPAPTSRALRAADRATQEAEDQAARRRRDRRVLVAVVVALVVLVVGGGAGVQAYRTKRAPTAVPAVTVSEAPQPVTGGQPIRFGDAGAPVTVTLYEDFHCPHCADFENELGPTLTAAQTAGAVRVEVYPMSFIDAGSTAAANAVACAAEAGFGQRYHLGLFANHTLQWSDSQLVDLAGLVGGGPTDAFAGCVTARAHADWVTSVNAAADAKGVTQTPTVFLDQAPVTLEGLTPATLQSQIDTAASGT
jgi:protein-disulfide isomerase